MAARMLSHPSGPLPTRLPARRSNMRPCRCPPIAEDLLTDGSQTSSHRSRFWDRQGPRRGGVVFQHACKMGLEGIVARRLGSRYRSGRSPDWLKFKNPEAPAVRREAEEDWGK
jgi:hypothetical protein